jgi:hypothetical protein
VGFERVSPVGNEQDQPAALFEHPHDLADRAPVVHNVFQNLVREDQVKGARGKGKGFTPGAGSRCTHRGEAKTGRGGTFSVELHTECSGRAWRYPFQVEAQAAAIVQDRASSSRAGGFKHDPKTALLAFPPDVGWLAIARGLL